MENHTNENKPDSVIVTLASSEYTIIAGAGVDIAVFLANPGSTDDYFKVNLLGIPPSWIEYSSPPAIWIPAGGQEKVSIKIHPPMEEGTTGSYLARLHVFSQSVPDKGKELEIMLKIVPEAKTKGTIQIHAESNEYKAVPGSEVKIPLVVRNLSPEAETLELTVQGVPTSWVSLPSPVISLPGDQEIRVEIILQVPSTPEIRAGNIPLKITAARQKEPSIKYEVEIKLRIVVAIVT
jgi:uncharacterized membrane protein